MRLKRLAITHLPGIRRAFAVDGFADGITVVTGPNASGKSSLVRALHHLIDPSSDRGGGALTLEAEFMADADRYTVTRTGSDVTWHRNGQIVERPPLPSGNFLHCYWLSMDDLLEVGDTDRAITERLRRELAGGFDLEAVRDAVPFAVAARPGRTEARTLLDRERALNSVVQRYEALDRERRLLPDLERRIREAADAEADARKHADALRWLEARRARVAAERRIDAFPEDMERLTGREIGALEELEQTRARLRDEQRAAARERDDAAARRDTAGLAGPPPGEAEIDAVRRHFDDARRIATRLEGDAEQLAAAAAEERQAADRLASTGELPPAIDAAAVDAAVTLAEQLRAAVRDVDRLEAAARAEPVDEDALAARMTAAAELRRWLRQPMPARRAGLWSGAALVLAVTAAGAAWLLGLPAGSVDGWPRYLPDAPLALTAVTAATLAAIAAGAALMRMAFADRERSVARARAAETRIELPAAFTPDAVAARLDALETEIAALQRRAAAAREAALHVEALERAREQRDALERDRQALAARLGFDPAATAEGVARFLGRVAALDDARTRHARLEARMQHGRGELAAELDQVTRVLERHGISLGAADASVADIAAWLDELDRRVTRYRDAERDIDAARRTLARIEADLESVDESIARLYRGAGLEPGDRGTLAARLERHAEYRAAVRDRDEARLVERERRGDVDSDPGLAALVEAGDEPALNARLSRLRTRAADLESLHAERAALQARLDTAGDDNALADAQLQRDRARTALEDAHRQTLFAAAGRFLIDDVAAEHRSVREPDVLAAARARLQRFTHGRFDIDLGGDGQLFARDTEQGTDQPLETLSTGTRMQLLIAVRLAWTAEMERAFEPLPVFLDEALTTTDPERFAAVARSLADTAAADARQLVYLTSQPADIDRFALAVGERPARVDLQRARFGDAEPMAADYAVEPPPPVPAPNGRSADDYAAALKVPAVAPRETAGTLHIFYLLRDDLGGLYELLQSWQVRRLGPLETLLASDAAEAALPDPERRARLAARCRIARLWVDLWRHGRGQPVDRNALEASGAVTARHIDKVSALAEDVGGDADALLARLLEGNVPYFRQNKVEELAEWLDAHGYRVPDSPLSADARLEQTLLAAGGFAPPAEIRAVVTALEAGLRAGERKQERLQ